MPTIKHIHPRRLKVGDKIWLESLPREVCRDGFPCEYQVTKITKVKGYFTGVNQWEVETSPAFGLPLAFSDKFRSLPPELCPVIQS